MATTTILSRVKTDFFAILVPGSFVFCVVVSVYMAFRYPDVTIKSMLDSSLKYLKEYWPLVIIFIIVGYLLGNVIRSIKVNTADRTAKKLFSRLVASEWDQLLFSSGFPYPKMLEKILEQLERSNLVDKTGLPDSESLHNAYNYWKISICSTMPDVFIYIENLESRARLFVGMFWAGFTGLLGSIPISIAIALGYVEKSHWIEFNIIMVLASGLIFYMFGSRIRRVRSQEVGTVFMAYLFLQQKKREEKTAQKNPPKPPVSSANVVDLISRFMGGGEIKGQ